MLQRFEFDLHQVPGSLDSHVRCGLGSISKAVVSGGTFLTPGFEVLSVPWQSGHTWGKGKEKRGGWARAYHFHQYATIANFIQHQSMSSINLRLMALLSLEIVLMFGSTRVI